MHKFKLTFGITAAALLSQVFAQEDVHHALIVARPASVEFFRQLPQSDVPEGTVLFGDIYRVTLSDIQVMVGNVTLEGELQVELVATRREYLENEDQIFVVLEVQPDRLTAVSWGISSRIACIPQELAASSDLETAFRAYTRIDGQRCTLIE